MVLIKNLVIAIVGVALALVIYAFVKEGSFSLPQRMPSEDATTTPPLVEDEVQYMTYQSGTYGISFSYPEGYVMREENRGDMGRAHEAIVLVREEDSMIPENGEGPTAITFDFYGNSAEQSTLQDWLADPYSNFQLGSGEYASTTVSGTDAVQYRWSGLYEGESTAFLHRDTIIVVSVTYFSPEDQNVAVYREILQSLQLN